MKKLTTLVLAALISVPTAVWAETVVRVPTGDAIRIVPEGGNITITTSEGDVLLDFLLRKSQHSALQDRGDSLNELIAGFSQNGFPRMIFLQEGQNLSANYFAGDWRLADKIAKSAGYPDARRIPVGTCIRVLDALGNAERC